MGVPDDDGIPEDAGIDADAVEAGVISGQGVVKGKGSAGMSVGIAPIYEVGRLFDGVITVGNSLDIEAEGICFPAYRDGPGFVLGHAKLKDRPGIWRKTEFRKLHRKSIGAGSEGAKRTDRVFSVSRAGVYEAFAERGASQKHVLRNGIACSCGVVKV